MGQAAGSWNPAADTCNLFGFFLRGGFAALVERLPDGGFGQIGAPGLLTGEAFAMLVSKKDGAVFVVKGREVPASAAQVDELRRFDRDLKEAIGASGG